MSSEHRLQLGDKGEVTLPLFELVESLSDEDKAKLAEMLAFDAALLRVVMSQVATEQQGHWMESTWYHGSDIIAELRALLLPQMDPIVQELIKYLLHEVEQANEGEKRYRRFAMDMRYTWPSGRHECEHCGKYTGKRIDPPADPGWYYVSGPTLEQVRSLFNAAILRKGLDG